MYDKKQVSGNYTDVISEFKEVGNYTETWVKLQKFYNQNSRKCNLRFMVLKPLIIRVLVDKTGFLLIYLVFSVTAPQFC